jgi:hypothetical protein
MGGGGFSEGIHTRLEGKGRRDGEDLGSFPPENGMHLREPDIVADLQPIVHISRKRNDRPPSASHRFSLKEGQRRRNRKGDKETHPVGPMGRSIGSSMTLPRRILSLSPFVLRFSAMALSSEQGSTSWGFSRGPFGPAAEESLRSTSKRWTEERSGMGDKGSQD